MTTKKSVLALIEECNKDRTKTLAEFIAVLFKDKFIEIYLSDSYEEVSLEQTSMNYPAVFCGKVVAAYRECLVLNCAYVHNKKPKLGSLLFINERAIKALNEVNGQGTIEGMFFRSKESLLIKDIKDE